jgi:hypothetical protein
MSNIKNEIFNALADKRKSAIGDSNRTLVDLAQDLVNAAGGIRHAKEIADDCFMAKATIERLCEADSKYEGYQPRAQTIEKILRYSNIRLDMKSEAISVRYQNKPTKEE